MAELHLPDELYNRIQSLAKSQGISPETYIISLMANTQPSENNEVEDYLLHSQIIQNMAEGVNLVYMDTAILAYVNPTSAHMFGYEPDELIGQHVHILTDPDFSKGSSKSRHPEVNQSLLKIGHWQGELHNVKKDGTMFWCYAHISTFEHPTYGLVSISVHQDITQRKQAQEELRRYREHLEELVDSRTQDLSEINEKLYASESRFRSIFEHAAVGIAETDYDGYFLSVNDKFCDIIKYSRAELLTKRYHDVSHPADMPEDDYNMQRLKAHEATSFSMEKRYIRKDGEKIWVLLTVSSVKDEADKIKNFVAIAEDISNRKQIEQELTQYQNHLEELVDQRTRALVSANELLERAERINQSGSWFTDLVNDKFIVSKGMYAVMGFSDDESPDEFTIDEFWKLVHPDDVKRIQDITAYVSENPVTNQSEYRIIRQDTGKERLVLTDGVAVLDDDGNFIGRAGIIRDITEQREIEEKRIALEVERKRVDMLSSFITHTNHHFQTPISVIRTAVYLLNRYIKDSDETIVERLLTITDQLDQISQLVDAMTMIVKLDSTKSIDSYGVIVDNTIKYVLERVGTDIQQTIVYEPYEDESLKVQGNAETLTHAIYCVVDNAIKYTPPDTTIMIQVAPHDDMVTITIADTGEGISQKDLDHIFKHFYRSDMAGTTRGLGLGLPIAKRIVELHNGSFEVESAENEGSTFKMTLPILE